MTEILKYKNAIIHSDQGMHYQLTRFTDKIKQAGLKQSMSRKPTPIDNAPIESFFHILKANLTHNQLYSSYNEFKEQFASFIQYYNMIV